VKQGRELVQSVALRTLVGIAIGALGFLLILPVVSLFLRTNPRDLLGRLSQPEVRLALRLSLETSLLATALVVLLGLPTAYVLATRRFPGRRVAEVLIELPMVMPPTVAGLVLLLTFGRAGLLGKSLEVFGISLPFSTAAVVIAQAFMAAPFFLGPVRAGFSTVEPRYREVAATLGASEMYAFLRVMLPLSIPSVIAGTAMACARSLGEFGATITFAGNLPGVTQTMPLAVYVELQHDLGAAITLSVLLVMLSFGLLLALRSGQARIR
jgi:molybdate transport system permease protein